MKNEALKNFNILVVDDEADLRGGIVRYLRRLGYSVFFANNGTEAFETLSEHKIDLAISDIRMPGGDGLYLLDRIMKEKSAIPVLILMTGFGDIEVEEALARGALHVLSKPFDLKDLKTLVEKQFQMKV